MHGNANSTTQAPPRRRHSRHVWRALLALASAFALAGAGGAQPAGAFSEVFWDNHGTGHGTNIGTYLNGSSAPQGVIGDMSGPLGVAVGGGYLYWANANTSSIGRVNVDGSEFEPRFIPQSAGVSNPVGVAVSGKDLFWANEGTGSIGHAALNKSGAPTEIDPRFVVDDVEKPYGVLSVGGYVYWSNTAEADSIWRQPADGGTPEECITLEKQIAPHPLAGFAVTGSELFWIDPRGTSIHSAALACPVTGRVKEGFSEFVDHPMGLAADGGRVYWGNGGGAASDTIERGNADLTGPATPLAKDAEEPLFIAVGPASPPAEGGAGSLFAFGSNEFGQLGNVIDIATQRPTAIPTLVTLPGASGPVTQVAEGLWHTLAATSSGQLYAFGANRFGQLGNAANVENQEPNPIPAPVALPGASGPVTQVAAGGAFSLALTSSGQLYAFGENAFGQLGNSSNDETEVPNPTPTLVTLPGASGPVTQIAAGAAHSLALTSTGQLYAFGDNRSGQLGNATEAGHEGPNSTPTPVTLPGASGPVTEVAAGGAHSLALTASGQLYAFGSNKFGQLGNSTQVGTDMPNPLPAVVALPGASGPVTQIAAGLGYSLAATSSGQLYAFGENRFGQLGNPTNDETEEPNSTPTQVALAGASGPVTQLAAGASHSLAVTSTGQLYAFGTNKFGQLGSESLLETEAPIPTPALVALPSSTTIDTVAKGSESYSTLAIVADLAIATSSLPGGQVGTPYESALASSGGTAPMSWSGGGLPPGLSIDPSSGVISGTPQAAGSFTVTLALADVYGASAQASVTLAVAPRPAVASSAPFNPFALIPFNLRTFRRLTSLVPVALTSLRQSAGKWIEGSALARISTAKHATPVGTTFTFDLTLGANVSFTFTYTAPGRRAGGRCMAPSKSNRSGRRCTRTLTAGALTFRAHAGLNRVRFQGRLSRSHKLKPGRYTLIATATAPSGLRSPPQRLSFTIVKR